jgi:hypothetical protein
MAMEHTIPERTFEFYAHVGSAISWHTRSTPVVMRRVSSAVDAAVRRIIAVVLWLRRPGRLRRLQRSSAADLASSARFQMAAGVMSVMTAKKTVRIDVRDSSECRRELRSPEGPSSLVDRRLGQRLLILWPASVDISRRVDTCACAHEHQQSGVGG